MWGQIIGALASGGMGMMGNKAAAGANSASMQMSQNQSDQGVRGQMIRDMENEAFQREANRIARMDAQGQLDVMREGYQDPSTGIRVRYVAGKGWVTEYSGAGKAIQDAMQTEQLKNLMVDQPMARRGRVQAEGRRLKEGSLADTILAQMTGGVDPYSDERIRADLTSANRRGIEDSFRGTQQAALMNSARTGTSGGNIIAKLAREKAKTYADADAGAYTDSLRTGEDLRGARTNRLMGQYGELATRANNVDNVALPGNEIQVGALSSASGRSGQMVNPSANQRAVQLGPAPSGNVQYNASAFPGAAQANNMYGMGSMFENIFGALDKSGKRKNSGDY